jgi:hypothetical protein
VRVSRSFSALPVTQARIKSILILFITYVWFSLNHIQDPSGVLDKKFRIYTLVTPIKSQQTDRMSCLHETRMNKSGMRRTMGGIDGGSTSMKPLADHLIRVIRYLLYHRQRRSLTWAIFLTYLTHSARYTKIYKVYISIYINR